MNFKKSQSGRSMVEMLGVLAIIGVLSVGGIAGYSLSMRRHRANQVVDLVSKYALSAYSACQQRVLNGEATTSCYHGYTSSYNSGDKIYLPFADTGIGALPAGVTGFTSWAIGLNATTGVDTAYMRVNFSDQKLCQAVASIAGSSCSKEGTGYTTEVVIKQN